VVFHGLDRTPTVRQRGAANGVRYRLHCHLRCRALGSACNRGSHGIAQAVVPGGVKAGSADASIFYYPAVDWPVFSDLHRFRLLGTQRSCQILAGCPAAVPVHDAHFVKPQPIDSIFLVEELGIVDEILLNVIVPIREHLPTRPALIREVQAVIRVAVGHAIEKPHAVVVKTAAGMVVHNIEKHSDAIDVTNIDQGSKLIVTPLENVNALIRWLASVLQYSVCQINVTLQLRLVDLAELVFGAVEVGAVVAKAEGSREFLDRQELDGIHAEHREIGHTLDYIEEAAVVVA
jgi:hypothetical protein